MGSWVGLEEVGNSVGVRDGLNVGEELGAAVGVDVVGVDECWLQAPGT